MYKKTDLPEIFNSLKNNAQTHEEKVRLRWRMDDILYRRGGRFTDIVAQGALSDLGKKRMAVYERNNPVYYDIQSFKLAI